MLHFDSSHSIVTHGSRVSRTPPHYTLHGYLNLNGSIIWLKRSTKIYLQIIYKFIFSA